MRSMEKSGRGHAQMQGLGDRGPGTGGRGRATGDEDGDQDSSRDMLSCMRRACGAAVIANLACVLGLSGSSAQETRVPTARLVPASTFALPGRVDSNNPLVWHDVDGVPTLTALTSWGGVPELARGPSLERLASEGGTTFEPHPGHGVWMEAVVPDTQGAW